MSALYPTNGLSVAPAPAPNGGILDTMLGEMKYLGEALAVHFTPAPAPEPAMAAAPKEDKLDASPSFSMTPSLTPGRRH